MKAYYTTWIVMLLLAACNKSGNTNNTKAIQESPYEEAATEYSDSVKTAGHESGRVCVSEDGRVSIESGIVPSSGTSPDFWAKWTITDDAGKKHVIEFPETPFQSKVHSITKKDGTVYYIVNCFYKSSSVNGSEWLEAYKIVGDTIQEVNVADGSSKINNHEFSIDYNIPSWYFATHGAGNDWILEYDIHTKNLYVPVTTEDGNLTDRYKIWHFDGNRFVCQSETSHKKLHKSLANYITLVRYATTRDYILRIDLLEGGMLRYASWKRPKTMADKPDIIIKGGKRQHYEVAPDKLRSCDDYRFHKGCFEYVINYCEAKKLDGGLGEHHDFLLVKRNGQVIVKQELDKNETDR